MFSAWLAWAVLAGALGGDGEVHAEAWVVAADPGRLQRAIDLGAAPAEGRRVRSDGAIEHRVLADAATLDRLEDAGFDLRVTREDHRVGPPSGGYTSLDQGEALLRDLADRSPRAGVVHLGSSVEGRPIPALWVGRHPDEPGGPSLRVMAAHHGDESSSQEVALDAARTLVERDGSDPRVADLLDRATVWILPWVNPDGVVRGSRFNARGVDLNRNYDYQWRADESHPGPAPFSEPETRAVRVQALYEAPWASLSLHSGETNIGYVWNHTTAPATDEAVLVELAGLYDEACTRPGFWVTNGAEWYRTWGDANDWSYGRQGGLDYTVELTADKRPDPEEIPEFTADHREAVLKFLLARPNLEGAVHDAVTGRPVPATVAAWQDGVAVTRELLADPVGGAFARRLPPGTTVLRVRAPGYLDAWLEVEISDGPAEWLEVPLEPGDLASGRPEPARVSGEPREVRFPGAVREVVLSRPGLPEVSLDLDQGRAWIDPDELAPGPWTVTLDNGTTWARALFVGDPSSRVSLAAVRRELLLVQGSGFGPGSRAYGLWGEDRALVPLPVVREDPDQVVVSLWDLPRGETADVLLVSNGSQQAILDVTRAPDVDTAAPRDTGSPVLPRELELAPVGCGCHGPAGVAPWWLLLLPVLRRRRRP